VCIFALLIQHAMCMHCIVICGLPGSKIFPHYLIKGTIFKKRKSCRTSNAYADFLYNFCVKHF